MVVAVVAVVVVVVVVVALALVRVEVIPTKTIFSVRLNGFAVLNIPVGHGVSCEQHQFWVEHSQLPTLALGGRLFLSHHL